MMKLAKATFAAGALLAAATAVNSQPFGTEDDTAYASQLWQTMVEAGLAGEGAVTTRPYAGTEPHGFMLETFYGQASIDGHAGDLVVKRNYGPEGVERSAVQADRAGHLASVTVMFRREEGYDPDNADWFWAKYNPDGSLQTNPNDMPLAGRVAKGADQGCIACHRAAPGGDYVFNNDRF